MKTFRIIPAFLCVLMSLPAWAGSYDDRAQVTAASPIYQTVNTPQQQCYQDNTAAAPQGGNTVGAVIGALAGGLLGSQVGNGNGKVAAGAIGAATGAVVGDRYQGNSGPTQHCQTVMQTSQQQIGYQVTYLYHGRQFEARMPFNPGPYLTVRVNVQPDLSAQQQPMNGPYNGQ